MGGYQKTPPLALLCVGIILQVQVSRFLGCFILMTNFKLIKDRQMKLRFLHLIILVACLTIGTVFGFTAMSMKEMEAMVMTGDFDMDFAKMMIIHHQSAIDMSEIQVANGKHEDMKAMAQKMIKAQKEEIQQFQTIINNYKAKPGQHTTAQHSGGSCKIKIYTLSQLSPV